MSSEQALLACPFCECGDAEMQPQVVPFKDRWVVVCLACSAAGPCRTKPCEAIAAWNTRALSPTAPTEEEVERLIERLRASAKDFERPPSIQSMEHIRAIDAMNDAAASLSTLRKAEPQSDAVREAVLAEIDNLDDEPTLYAHFPQGPWKQPDGSGYVSCACGQSFHASDCPAARAEWAVHARAAIRSRTSHETPSPLKAGEAVSANVTQADSASAAQDKRRAALVERMLKVADLACTTPLQGELGDVAYDLLREGAAQIASDRQAFTRHRIASTNVQSGDEALVEALRNIANMTCRRTSATTAGINDIAVSALQSRESGHVQS